MNCNMKRARRLIDEGMGCLGMIAEVRTKSHLLKNRLREANLTATYSEELEQEAAESLVQMRADLAKYSRRLKRIYEELQSYGIVPNLE